ncbi:DASH complex, subunit Spc34 [Annulohypoxylon truncatum]|uniref:DASH complex, subunit Spc34 n=1 Tax=Annulohypoxylon truncatum TaxID=327061 RepID=UPI002008751A|nr:DASH complex, subunit Spc34 [Annulohypoxylon truncatum]KAI1207638.1 DASH complex, subunit Spc34 [Annulohypoxylon truncatum]
MSLLPAHFEQIAISCQGIDSLPFPPPKIFTNALLVNDDITSLIRDTEPHERALFSVPPPPPPGTSQNPEPPTQSSRRQTVFNVASGEVTTSGGNTGRNAGAPRRHTAVAAVLGGGLHEQIRRSERRGGKDDIDVEILLKGAEKLCGVYPLPGALERIAAQRSKYAHSRSTLAYYEAKVAEQAEALGKMNKDHWMDDDEEEEEREQDVPQEGEEIYTEEDLIREGEQIRELEKKKRELQERLQTIDKDIDGLLHM